MPCPHDFSEPTKTQCSQASLGKCSFFGCHVLGNDWLHDASTRNTQVLLGHLVANPLLLTLVVVDASDADRCLLYRFGIQEHSPVEKDMICKR